MASFLTCCLPASGPETYEYTTDEIKELYEQCLKLNSGRLIVEGMFARADTVNTNKRSYPKRLLVREVRRYKQQHVKTGTALGELDHPSYASDFFRVLNVPNISHQVLRVWWRGKELWGCIEVLPTPSGLLLWDLYSRGVKVGVSSRSWASLVRTKNGACQVGDDMELITFDFVVDPSNSGAFLLPLTRRFRRRVPDQWRAVQLAHLGVGSCGMEHAGRLPQPKVVHDVLARLRQQAAAAEQRAQQQQPHLPHQQQQREWRPTPGPLQQQGQGTPPAKQQAAQQGRHPQQHEVVVTVAEAGRPLRAPPGAAQGCSGGEQQRAVGERRGSEPPPLATVPQQEAVVASALGGQVAPAPDQEAVQMPSLQVPTALPAAPPPPHPPPPPLQQQQKQGQGQPEQQGQQGQQQPAHPPQQQQPERRAPHAVHGLLQPSQSLQVGLAAEPGPHPLACDVLQAPPTAVHAPGTLSLLGATCVPVQPQQQQHQQRPGGVRQSSGGGGLPPPHPSKLGPQRPASADGRGSAAAAAAGAAVEPLPLNAAMPGGVLRVVSHYRALPDHWLPLDPHGRCLAPHLANTVAKALLAAATAASGAVPRPGGAATSCGGAAPPSAGGAAGAAAAAGPPRLQGLRRDMAGSSDSLQCAGVRGATPEPSGGGAGAGSSGGGARLAPSPSPPPGAAGARSTDGGGGVALDEAVAVQIEETLQASAALTQQWRDHVMRTLA